jgi:hypothetical protein
MASSEGTRHMGELHNAAGDEDQAATGGCRTRDADIIGRNRPSNTLAGVAARQELPQWRQMCVQGYSSSREDTGADVCMRVPQLQT